MLVRCDDDLEPAPARGAVHLAAHRAPTAGAGASWGRTGTSSPTPPTPATYGRPADGAFPDGRLPRPADTTWRYWAGNASVTRGTADRVGGYDEAFRAYGWEDVDWGRRLHLLGIPVVLEPALETTHRLSAVTAASRVERAYFSGAARRQFVAKHGLSELAPRRPDSSWTRAVALVARALTESRARRAARAADAVARVLPARVAHVLVALLVEGASEAGYRHGSVDDPTAV